MTGSVLTGYTLWLHGSPPPTGTLCRFVAQVEAMAVQTGHLHASPGREGEVCVPPRPQHLHTKIRLLGKLLAVRR